ncbi:hypothetical protein HC256_008800 [Beauveria bassiana]|nr:hypothetical protein HC256_008800 [Beauveria bassiana]
MTENFVRVMESPGDAMPAHIRAVYMPGIFVTVGDMVRAVGAVCGEEKLALLKVERDVEAERLLKSWPQTSDFGDAKRLGLVFDSDCEQILQDSCEPCHGPLAGAQDKSLLLLLLELQAVDYIGGRWGVRPGGGSVGAEAGVLSSTPSSTSVVFIHSCHVATETRTQPQPQELA